MLIILGIILSLIMTFLYCCLVISSRCSRLEEENVYENEQR